MIKFLLKTKDPFFVIILNLNDHYYDALWATWWRSG